MPTVPELNTGNIALAETTSEAYRQVAAGTNAVCLNNMIYTRLLNDHYVAINVRL